MRNIRSTRGSQRLLHCWSSLSTPQQSVLDIIGLIPIGTLAVALFAISVQLYFHTNSFAQEYRDRVSSLVVEANGKIASKIEALLETSTKLKTGAESVLPLPKIDIREQTLSEIRRIAAQADDCQTSLVRGKSHLRRSALWLAVCAIVLVVVVFITVFKTGLDTALVLEYAGGIPTVLFLSDISQFYRIQRKLDSARIE